MRSSPDVFVRPAISRRERSPVKARVAVVAVGVLARTMDHVAVMSYGLPTVQELLDGASWRFDLAPPLPYAPYENFVTEDTYGACKRYRDSVFEHLAACLQAKREEPLIAQHGALLLAMLTECTCWESEMSREEELVF